MFCPYKNMFGEPNKGIHSVRLFNIAILDVLQTIVVAWIIHYYTGWSFLFTVLVLFIIGICLHRLFCVRTTVDRFIFGDDTA